MMPRNLADYEEDFYAWNVEQARLLRSGEFSSIDVANVAEEIESLGRGDKRELESRLTVLLMHLATMANTIENEVAELVGNDTRATSADREAIKGISQSAALYQRGFGRGL